MSATGLFYTNEKHAKTQPRFMDFTYSITAAKTVSPYPIGADSFTFFDAITQAQIDAYLGTTNEFLAAQFDATAMGTDAFGGLIRMSGAPSTVGQAAVAVRLVGQVYSGAGFATLTTGAALGSAGIAASTLSTAVAVSTNGNLAFRFVATGLDALTSGIIVIRVGWIATPY